MTKTVLVCEAQAPFVQGGVELLVRGLPGDVFPQFGEDYGDGTFEAFLSHQWSPPPTLADRWSSSSTASTASSAIGTRSLSARRSTWLANDPRTAQSLGDAGYDRTRSISRDARRSTHGARLMVHG